MDSNSWFNIWSLDDWASAPSTPPPLPPPLPLEAPEVIPLRPVSARLDGMVLPCATPAPGGTYRDAGAYDDDEDSDVDEVAAASLMDFLR